MEIRNYQSRDRDQVVALWLAVFPHSIGHNEPGATIDRKLTVNDHLFFVAEVDESIVGTVIVGYDGHRGWIYSLAVKPLLQRQKIGTNLVGRAETALANLGCPKLNLQVRTDNDAVVGFYQTLGYRVEDRISMGKLMDPIR